MAGLFIWGERKREFGLRTPHPLPTLCLYDSANLFSKTAKLLTDKEQKEKDHGAWILSEWR